MTTSGDGAHFRFSGTVRLGVSRCRLSAQLLGAESGRQVWAERYDELTDDPFAIVDACAPRIVMSVRRQVASEDAARLRDRPLDELSATELMALGGASFFNPTYEGWRGGGVLAEHALQVAPDHFMALAMAAAGLGLADPLYGHQGTPPSVQSLALERIEEALRRQNRSDMLHAVHAGLLLYGSRRHRAAEAAARRSLEVNDAYNMGLWMLAAAQVFGGDPQAGCDSAVQAVAVNDSDPYLHLYSRVAGYGHLEAGRTQEAADWFGRADQLAPGLTPNLMAMAVASHRLGDRLASQEAIDRLRRAEPGFRVADAHPLPYAEAAAWERYREDLLAAGAPP